MIEIPKNDWRPDPIDEKKVDMAIKHIVEKRGGTMYTWYGLRKSPPCLENLSVDEIRHICRMFIKAGWHVYVPELREDGRVPVTISRLPRDVFNVDRLVRQDEVKDPNNIVF